MFNPYACVEVRHSAVIGVCCAHFDSHAYIWQSQWHASDRLLRVVFGKNMYDAIYLCEKSGENGWSCDAGVVGYNHIVVVNAFSVRVLYVFCGARWCHMINNFKWSIFTYTYTYIEIILEFEYNRARQFIICLPKDTCTKCTHDTGVRVIFRCTRIDTTTCAYIYT